MGLDARGLLCQVGLICENPKVRQHNPESHQCDASANPREKRSLLGEIISQIRHWLSFDLRIHFRLPVIGQARKTPAIEKPANTPVSFDLFCQTRNDLPVIGVIRSVLLLNTCGSNPHDLEVAAVAETRHAFSRPLNAGRRGLGDDPLDAAGTAPALDAAAEAIVDLLRAQRLLSRCSYHVAYLVVTEHVA
jgi:hypothetical protein